MSGSTSTPARDDSSEIAGRMAGEYRLGRKLGEGGFGAVYEAEHPVLKRRAAVKVLHRVGDRDSEAVLRFISEAQAVNQIRTRHIVDIFSFGKLPDGRHFYVMDLLDGEPLDQYLARNGKLEVGLLIQILRPIAEALDRAHAAGIVHRDLKPQNIFLSWDASGVTVPILLDFGVAKLLGESPVRTISGTPIGTPLYMSPEQARGEKVDGRADVYSLGVLCHELLTGRPPINGDTTIAVLMAHLIEPPPSVSQTCPELSPLLDAPILHMLEKKAADRPESAGAALKALSDCAERAGIAVPSGLPSLPRPEPVASRLRASELARTLEWSQVGEIGLEGDASGLARATRSGAGTRRYTGVWLGVLVVLGVIAAYFFATSKPYATETPPSAAHEPAVVNVPPVEVPAAAEPPGVPPGVVPAPAAEPATPARGDEKSPHSPRKSRRSSGEVHEAIPSDLESPF